MEDDDAPVSPTRVDEGTTINPTTPGIPVGSPRHITPEDVLGSMGGRPFVGSPPHRTSFSDDVVVDVASISKQRFFKPPHDKDRDSKRRKTSHVLDSSVEDKSTMNRNIILPLDRLVLFLETNFVCKRCRNKLSTFVDNDESKPPLRFDVFGLACGLNFHCRCGAQDSLRPKVVDESLHKIGVVDDKKPIGNRLNSGDFEINKRLHLGLQLCGNGRHDGAILAGMLKLNVNPMRKRWTEVQESLSKAIIQIGGEVLDENLHIECLHSPTGKDGRYALDVASDTRWDKRGSTRRYDSLSGCSVAFGLRTNLPVGIEAMSQVCIKCSKGIVHDDDVCPKNYVGSAKGMEATGAARIVSRLFANVQNKCYVANLVTDDDSSVRKILTHSYQELVEALQMTDAEWPRYSNGRKRPDNGLLPLLHAIIKFLADKGHRVRGYTSFLFAESVKSISNGCGCTKVDAERMKRRLSWTLRLHCFGTYEEFKTAVLAVLEHHFNNHIFCGDWCKSGQGTTEQIQETGLRFRCKTRNNDLYLVMKKHHEKFMEEGKLRQLFHQYDTNTVEGFNKFLTKFLPKDRTYCQTVENKARTMLAGGLQSIGYRQFYKRVFTLTGIEMEEDDITSLFFGQEDSSKLWKKEHRRKESVKVTRMRMLYQKLKDGVAKLKVDNSKALGYSSGMMGPDGSNEEHGRRPKNRCVVGQKPDCPHCGRSSHSRKTSKQCPFNPKYAPLVDVSTTQPGTWKCAGATVGNTM
jgi:hypothetical protein